MYNASGSTDWICEGPWLQECTVGFFAQLPGSQCIHCPVGANCADSGGPVSDFRIRDFRRKIQWFLNSRPRAQVDECGSSLAQNHMRLNVCLIKLISLWNQGVYSHFCDTSWNLPLYIKYQSLGLGPFCITDSWIPFQPQP